ncbi:hypothetical protein H2200_005737 [Cladophialophora chaetospira]|uniref:Rhodopsin domain-containing protein n=1 Tax=Cladophialophora chaetospira TaxID=386627 RepID=A0AA38X9S8_9EURO|nr:hypothetical protein H2200_005737 [Cladophialophora chaetospira]
MASFRPQSWPHPNYTDPEKRGGAALFICTCLTTAVVVMLRLYSRVRLTKSPGMDDWLLVAGFVLSIGQTFGEYKALTTWGWNMHVWDVPIDRLMYIRLSAWLIECFFLLGNACTKTSILLAYRRISARTHSTWFVQLTWAAIAFTIVYTVAFGLELVFVCRPFVSYWRSYSPDYTEKYTCGNEQIPIVLSAAASVFSDIYASILPMLLVRTLKLSSRQRLGLYLLFSAGLLTAGIGTARLLYLVKVTTNYRLGPDTADITWYGWPTFVSRTAALTDIEAHLAIICASLPALKVLFQRRRDSRAANVYPSRQSRWKPLMHSPPPTHGSRDRISPIPRRSLVSNGEGAASSKFLDRIPTPDSGSRRNDCRCALCRSIDALEKGLATPST